MLTFLSHLTAPLWELAPELGTAPRSRDLPAAGRGGWCDREHQQIVIATGAASRKVRTLVHEVARALGVGYQHEGRERAEVSSTASPTSSARASGSKSATNPILLRRRGEDGRWPRSATTRRRATRSCRIEHLCHRMDFRDAGYDGVIGLG